jgi:hypothetical protein
MAGRIMRSAAAHAATACSCAGEDEMCDECRQKHSATIARKSTGNPNSVVSHKTIGNALRSSGHPLDPAARAFFEPRFGSDFGDVRVHTGQEAQNAARTIHAHAFTLGNEIYFASGQYAPDTDSGRALIAHELTHTLQQQGSGVRDKDVVPRQDDGGTRTTDSDRDLDAGAGPAPGPSPDADTVLMFQGMSLTADSQKVRQELEGYLQDWGLEVFERLEPTFVADLQRRRYENSPTYLSDVSGVPDWIETNRRQLALMEQVAPLFHTEWDNLWRQAREFLSVFDVQAHAVLDEMLTASQDRILSERERYGLSATFTERTKYTVGDFGERAAETEIEAHYSMSRNSATQGLAQAASGLLQKVRVVRARMDDRNNKMPITYGDAIPSDAELADYRAADSRVQEAVRDYNVARSPAESDYPILAAYTPLDTTGTYYVDQTIDHLSQVARGSSTDLAEKLYDETAEKLANIDKVYRAVAEGDLKVWKLPAVVGLTQDRVHMLAPAVQAKLVEEKVQAAESEGEILHIALAVLAVALGLIAAIPTGGSSLVAGVAFAAGVGTAAISSYLAIEHIQQYSLEAAENGTDFDKARAVSQVEPSLFWLAVDIVGAIADIHAAAAAFRVLSTALREASELRRLAQAGQKAAEAEEAVRRLAEEGERYAPGRGLGRKLTEAVGEHGGALEKDAAVAAWEGGLSPTTHAYLVDNPELRAIYRDMDPQLRWLCTHCSDNCLIAGISRAQVARIRAALERVGPEEIERMRIYLHVRKNSIEAAIVDLERVADENGLRALLDRTLTETANPPTAPILTSGAATTARNASGAAAGGEFLPISGRTWLQETGGSAGLIPGQVAARLRTRTFASFDEFQEAFWREVAADAELSAGFTQANRTLMAQGQAPFAQAAEQYGGTAGGRFILHHIVPIEHGGGVYDMSNLLVTSPRLHAGVIHSPTVPMAPFRQLPPPE